MLYLRHIKLTKNRERDVCRDCDTHWQQEGRWDCWVKVRGRGRDQTEDRWPSFTGRKNPPICVLGNCLS